ncbi:MAG: HEPN domain-containing protein [Niabella sp.]
MIHNEELKRQSEKILKLIEDAENTFEEDDEMRSHLAKYICILCSGFLENAIQSIYGDFVKKETTNPAIISFVTVTLNKIQNPNSNKFKEIAKSFKTEWESSLNLFLQEDERSTALNYIIRDRHKIAHGKDSDITLTRIKEYHNKTVDIIKYLEHQCELVPV